MKGEAGLLKLERESARVQVIGGVGMRQEEEEMSDSGRWRRGLRLPNWIPKALESATARTQKHMRTPIEWKCCAVLASTAPVNKELMPSSGLQAARLHYPEMDKSIWSNYINQWNIRFLWKQMWVVPHKSLPSVKYSRTCDVSLSNEQLNSCITAVVDMMWWISDAQLAVHLYIMYMLCNNLSLTPSAASFFWGLILSKHISARTPFLFYPSITWLQFMWFDTITMATRCIILLCMASL